MPVSLIPLRGTEVITSEVAATARVPAAVVAEVAAEVRVPAVVVAEVAVTAQVPGAAVAGAGAAEKPAMLSAANPGC